jgi:hypothetical protein
MYLSNRKYLTLVVSLLFMAGMTLSSSGSILCLGADGHVEVESIGHAPCCDDGGLACAVEPFEAEQDHHDDCGDCTDLPLIRDLTIKRHLSTASYDESNVTFLSVLPIIPPINRSIQTVNSRPWELAPASSIPPDLGTTVLRC